MERERALVIEDEKGVALLNKRLLELEGFAVDIAMTASEGARLAHDNDYALVTLDIVLPDGDGITLLGTIRERDR
jgi:DNA-binding response OmpR family regulator